MKGVQLLALAAALFDTAAALAHFACIVWGRGLRLMGAGERMARMAEAGHWYPPLVSAAIGVVLSLLAGYALAGAGLLGPCPSCVRCWSGPAWCWWRGPWPIRG